MGIDWNIESRRRLKVELARKEIGFSDLAVRLRVIGVDLTEEGLRAKVKRGMFPLSFFLQCMAAIETSSVSMDIPEATSQSLASVAGPQCSARAESAMAHAVVAEEHLD